MSAQTREHLGRIFESKVAHLDLSRAPAKQRAFTSQHIAFHKTLIAAAKNEKSVRFLKCPIDGDLENRRQRLVAHRRIGKLVKHENEPLGARPIGDERQRISPRQKSAKRCGKIEKASDSAIKIRKIVGIALLERSKRERPFTAAELVDQRRLSHAPATIHDGHLK